MCQLVKIQSEIMSSAMNADSPIFAPVQTNPATEDTEKQLLDFKAEMKKNVEVARDKAAKLMHTADKRTDEEEEKKKKIG